MCAILRIWENHRAKGGFTPLVFCGGFKQPSRRKKGGRYNVCYISGFNPDRYTHCRPCEFDLSDLQGKKKQPPLLPIVTADCLQQKFKLIVRGRAASMALPFSVFNIAYLAAGFKSQTHVYCNVVVKAVCCPLILLSGDPTFQNTHKNTPQAHISQFKDIKSPG